jgi:hypothetical protein
MSAKHEHQVYTEAELEMIKDYTTIMTGKSKGGIFKNHFRKTIWAVTEFIERYGDDGYGDKPSDMNRVEYWLSHIKV